MTVHVNNGCHPHNLVWNVNIIENVQQYESNVFVLEKAQWRLRLLKDMHYLGTEENLKMFLRKLHPEESYESFLISIYIEDKNKKLENLITLRSVFPRTGEDVIMWRCVSDICLRHPDIVLKGIVTFVIMFLPDHNFDSDMEYYTGK